MKNSLANILSAVLNPFVVLVISMFLLVFSAGLSERETYTLLAYLLLIALGVPLGLLTYARKKRIVSNLDITERSERRLPLRILLVLILVDLVVVHALAGFALSRYFLMFLVWAVGFTVITDHWKISGHSSTNTLAAALIIHAMGIAWWPVAAIIPLVSWSRVIRRDHTVAQVSAGFLYSLGIYYTFTSFLF